MKDASTVILLRPCDRKERGNFEVLMLLRHPKSNFVPCSYVFPGGVIDAGDVLPEMQSLCKGITACKALTILDEVNSPVKALGLWIAGIRETFEEAGLLMAYRKDGTIVPFDSKTINERFRKYSHLLYEKKKSFSDILREEELTLAGDALHYFSHWISPGFFSRQYDVRFFVARAPANQKAFHDGVELIRHIWITPQEALARYKKQDFDMILPTVMTIEELSRFEKIDDIIQSTKEKRIRAVRT